MSQPKRHLDRFSRFRVHRSKVSQCFSMGRTTPKIAPSLEYRGAPIKYMVSWAHLSQLPERIMAYTNSVTA